MKVTFADFGPGIASSRLRAIIPQQEFAKMGIQSGRDVLIYGKHWIPDEMVTSYKTLIYDVCDDHFDNEFADYYRRHISMADEVTCNSEVMKEIIKAKTGRDAVVVREPYEHEEHHPGIAPRLFWYGHKSNAKDLERLIPSLHHPLLAMSNHPDHAQWSPETFNEVMEQDCIVIIPTGKSMAKSENRMVEAIRCGKYVCAEYLPAYDHFTSFFPLGNIPEHIESALANPLAAIARIKEAQEFIRERYSPASIAGQWLEVIRNVHHDKCRVGNSGRKLAASC